MELVGNSHSSLCFGARNFGDKFGELFVFKLTVITHKKAII